MVRVGTFFFFLMRFGVGRRANVWRGAVGVRLVGWGSGGGGGAECVW